MSETDFKVVPLEGGHTMMFTSPTTNKEHQEEKELVEYLQNKLWEGKYTPEFEDILSGRGVEEVYKFLTRNTPNSPVLKASQISDAANGRSDQFDENTVLLSQRTLLIHYNFLSRLSKNLSILLQTQGKKKIYLLRFIFYFSIFIFLFFLNLF